MKTLTWHDSCLLLAIVAGLLAACSGQPAASNPTPSLVATALTVTAVPQVTPVEVRPAPPPTPAHEPGLDTPDWFDDAVLYEIFVRSFYDSDGDGIGDLDGVSEKLDYLENLGVTAIWLMPIYPSPSYHGYDVVDYFAVNPDYGSLNDMIELVDAAHGRGIKIIIDLVVNHMADDNPIFQDAWGNPDSPYADWFLWTNEDHTAYQGFAGLKDMPRLNHNNPEVVDFVKDIARFWLDLDGDGDTTDGVDGFRCDVAKDVPLSTWQPLRAEMRRLNPNSLLLGEVWDTNAHNLARFYGDAFDALFDFPLYADLAGSHDQNLDSLLAGVRRPDMVDLTILAEDQLFPPGYQIVRFINNHDTNRVMSDVGLDWERARTAAMLLLTLPGTPMIYYGEEIGMRGEKGQGNPYWDEFRREPMDWYAAEEGPGMTTWFHPQERFNRPADGISVQEQEDVANSLLNHYRALIALRRTHPALRDGAFMPVTVTGSELVYATLRHAPPTADSPEERFLVILNFSAEPQAPALQLDQPDGGPFTVVDALSGASWPDIPAGEPYQLELPAKHGLILQLHQSSNVSSPSP